jgi:hypothetical protein
MNGTPPTLRTDRAGRRSMEVRKKAGARVVGGT